MQEIINTIIEKNKKIFGDNPEFSKINVGFTNTIYNVNDLYIIKICTNLENEDNFKKEINFYNSNKDNDLIPKLYFSDTTKEDIPYYYEIIEKARGISLYNVWHTFSESQREDIVRQICDAMKQMHSNTGDAYDWVEYFKNKFSSLYSKVLELNIFSDDEQQLLNHASSRFADYLKSDEFVLVHNDLHFDNILYDDGQIKIIDFERSMYAPRDFDLDIFFRMVRKPWKFASDETEEFVSFNDYQNIPSYVKKYYPEIMATPYLTERLAIYDIVYFLSQYVKHPEIEELKEDVLNATKKVA